MVMSVCLVALAVIAPSALADPNGPSVPPHRVLNGVGSALTQDVMNALSNVIVDDSGNKMLSSWNVAGSSITTGIGAVNNSICTITRSASSEQGMDALRRSLTNGPGGGPDGCLQFARSSATAVPGGGGASLSMRRFAVDGLSYVIRTDSAVSRSLTRAQLQTIYNCQGPAGGPNPSVIPKLPAFGSETRAAFISLILGLTDSPTFAATRPCISEVDNSGAPLRENDGRLLTSPAHIAPYSIPRYLDQIHGVIADVHGKTVLGSINAVSPAVLNTSTPATRPVSNAFPTSQEPIAPTSTVFVGPDSLICQQPNVITRYGFALLPPGSCGTPVLSVGHFEIDMDYDSSTLTLDVREETSNPPNDDLPTANALIVAPPRALNTVPTTSGFACLGSPGSPVYLLPQSHNPSLAAPAFNTEDVPLGALSNDKVTLELVSWTTPPGGRFAAYNSSVSGPLFRFNTNSAPGCQVTTFPGGGINTGIHLHTWFAFSATGTYTLTFRATATTTGGVPKSSGDQTYTFLVG